MLPLYTRSTRSGSWKDCVNQRHGAFRPGSCTVYRVLSNVCLVADLPSKAHTPAGPPAALQLATTDGHCRTTGKPGVTYRPVAPPHGRSGSTAVPQTTPFGPFTLAIRSREDPLLSAARLTNDTLTFGPTQDDERRSALVQLVLGAVFCVPLLGAALVRAVQSDAAARFRQRWWRQRVPTSEPMGLAMVETDERERF